MRRRSSSATRFRRWIYLAALPLLVFAGLTLTQNATAESPPNSAGLVIRHGDGSVSYYLVHFGEQQITGTQLLERAGVQVKMTPYAGMGEAVCRIDGEGCPSANCFCKSYTNPSIYWHYYKLSNDGTWTLLPYGPDQRTVRNGDVDGWSWSSQTGDLPPTSLEKIARVNGVALPATPTVTVLRAATPPMVPSQATPKVTVVPSTPAAVVLSQATPIAVVRPTIAPAIGVKVESSGQTSSIQSSAPASGTKRSSYVWFAAGLVALFAVGLVVVVRQRRREP